MSDTTQDYVLVPRELLTELAAIAFTASEHLSSPDNRRSALAACNAAPSTPSPRFVPYEDVQEILIRAQRVADGWSIDTPLLDAALAAFTQKHPTP